MRDATKRPRVGFVSVPKSIAPNRAVGLEHSSIADDATIGNDYSSVHLNVVANADAWSDYRTVINKHSLTETRT